MAVLQMQRISICALKKNRKQILEILQRRGVVELLDTPLEDSVFQKSDTSAEKARLERSAFAAERALEVLDTYVPVKASLLSSLEGRKSLSPEEYTAFADRNEEVLRTASQLSALSKRIADDRADLQKLQTQLDALAPWIGLNVSMRFEGTRTTVAFIGSFAEDLTLEVLTGKLAELIPDIPVDVTVVSHSQDITCVFILALRRDERAVEDALRSIGFTRPASPPQEAPTDRREILEKAMEADLKDIEAATAEVVNLAGEREALQLLIDYSTLRAEKYDAIRCLTQSRSTFLLSGYVPGRNAQALASELEGKFDVAIEFADPGEEEDVPVLLQNNGFSSPVESVIESYSLPSKGEIDPTSIVSIFYYFLFGLMLSDFGYGAILAIATGWILLRYKNMEPGMRNNMKLFFFCGISTMAWGVVFSSYFGDAVDTISRVFFGREITIPPAWFVPLEDPMRLMVFCMAVGVVHLFTGLAIQLHQHLKAGRYYEAFSKVILWYMLVGGLIVYGLSTELLVGILQLKFMLPAAVGSVAGWIAAAGAVGIVVTNGDSKNIGVRFAQGLYELYNVTGYLSDILSYSRLLALGLATGVIGSVINQMGSMGGGGVVGGILFVLVFLLGHTLNFGIELLGAYVHCNRLQYVEFFGKFYEGGGRKFSPFAAHTKYYKFKEDIHNG